MDFGQERHWAIGDLNRVVKPKKLRVSIFKRSIDFFAAKATVTQRKVIRELAPRSVL